MLTLLSINWNPNPELFNLFGSLPIRYYGLLWVVGIALAYVIVHRQYHDRKIDEKTFEPLFFYCFFGILVGARLGHCLFYQPDYYLNHFWEMILPVKFLPDGGWKFTGYEGLASHGGTLGLIIALWMYCRKTKMHYKYERNAEPLPHIQRHCAFKIHLILFQELDEEAEYEYFSQAEAEEETAVVG